MLLIKWPTARARTHQLAGIYASCVLDYGDAVRGSSGSLALPRLEVALPEVAWSSWGTTPDVAQRRRRAETPMLRPRAACCYVARTPPTPFSMRVAPPMHCSSRNNWFYFFAFMIHRTCINAPVLQSQASLLCLICSRVFFLTPFHARTILSSWIRHTIWAHSNK